MDYEVRFIVRDGSAGSHLLVPQYGYLTVAHFYCIVSVGTKTVLDDCILIYSRGIRKAFCTFPLDLRISIRHWQYVAEFCKPVATR
jgi:hypothetical protein